MGDDKKNKKKLTFPDRLAAWDSSALAGVITQQVELLVFACSMNIILCVVDLCASVPSQEHGT